MADNRMFDHGETPMDVERYLADVLESNGIHPSDDASGFVSVSDIVPDALLEIRYFSTFNFVGERIDGYEEPLAFLTREAAEALKEVSDELVAQGYRLKVFDAYRPQQAVTHFARWAVSSDDARMKESFFPEPREYHRPDLVRHEIEQGSGYGRQLRLFREIELPDLYRGNRRAVREPLAVARYDDGPRVHADSKRMVAFHASG